MKVNSISHILYRMYDRDLARKWFEGRLPL